jgi:hypothetical protein
MHGGDGIPERAAAHLAHHVEGTAIQERTRVIHRHHTGVLEPRGDLGLCVQTLRSSRCSELRTTFITAVRCKRWS